MRFIMFYHFLANAYSCDAYGGGDYGMCAQALEDGAVAAPDNTLLFLALILALVILLGWAFWAWRRRKARKTPPPVEPTPPQYYL